jgi:hypothetical protein
MSALGILALLREAHAALPHGTAQERTAWMQQRRRELESQPPSDRSQPVSRKPQPFSRIADDPAVRRTAGEE